MGVTGIGAISTINNPTKLKKHFIRVFSARREGLFIAAPSGTPYKLWLSTLNQRGRMITRYIPIKQPGDTGPNPIIANTENTARHLIWATFIGNRVGLFSVKRNMFLVMKTIYFKAQSCLIKTAQTRTPTYCVFIGFFKVKGNKKTIPIWMLSIQFFYRAVYKSNKKLSLILNRSLAQYGYTKPRVL
jgi:hypothetical protein